MQGAKRIALLLQMNGNASSQLLKWPCVL